ncbi:FMN-dependent NADH:quinone oxidoreductase [Rhodovastum atsumiense]|uniref:FMN dependent NADH:quinone oxidoreductase n=1 Tax=Rhodovastum atsumiense TaxID=504468 RepID=A0A5M6IRW2_9PROT|nr:FMN-dependent NADH-azoreductase [Rhodovastum atsumiense]KAA5610308.1 FMN-dependent NADH-azoreductase [Rhodovastum atsumiense]CAH2602202.1 FMN-dependent NADH:quinone oxidoreductase [Rhodovastum atsumiense]
MNILHIDSSALGDASASRRLTAAIVATLRQSHLDATIAYRDLAAAPPAHLSGQVLQAMTSSDPAALTEAQQQERSLTDALLAEFLGADVVVIGAPMYNFSIPTQLKAWIDRIAQAGKTFRYTANGPVGLAGGKRVVIASSRGGIYAADTALQALDHQETYLRTVFGFLGITDVTIIRAEGLALGEAPRASAFAQAETEIQSLAA